MEEESKTWLSERSAEDDEGSDPYSARRVVAWEDSEDPRAVWLLKTICSLLQVEVLNKPVLICPAQPDKDAMEILLS